MALLNSCHVEELLEILVGIKILYACFICHVEELLEILVGIKILYACFICCVDELLEILVGIKILIPTNISSSSSTWHELSNAITFPTLPKCQIYFHT